MTLRSVRKDNLCAVVVLYNPDDTVISNIYTFISEVSHVYVIDNSESINLTLQKKICQISQCVRYHSMGSNHGIASALNMGCQLAYNDGFEWIITMDQDSYFDSSDFFRIVGRNHYGQHVAIIAASYHPVHFRSKPSDYHGFLDVGFVITSGNILKLGVWRQLRGFTEKLFIDEVDNEFCIRAINAGYKILATETLYLRHHLGSNLQVRHPISRKQISVSIHPPIRIYYMVRNNLYLIRHYTFGNSSFIINRIRNMISLLMKVLFYFPAKSVYLKHILQAWKDSLAGRYGKKEY